MKKYRLVRLTEQSKQKLTAIKEKLPNKIAVKGNKGNSEKNNNYR